MDQLKTTKIFNFGTATYNDISTCIDANDTDIALQVTYTDVNGYTVTAYLRLYRYCSDYIEFADPTSLMPINHARSTGSGTYIQKYGFYIYKYDSSSTTGSVYTNYTTYNIADNMETTVPATVYDQDNALTSLGIYNYINKKITYGTADPSDSDGNEGDIYLKYET